MTIGKKIREIRKEQETSQEQLAMILGVSRQTVSSWENERTIPSMESLIDFCQHYHLSLDEFLSFERGQSTPNITSLLGKYLGFLLIYTLLTVLSMDSLQVVLVALGILVFSFLIVDISKLLEKTVSLCKRRKI